MIHPRHHSVGQSYKLRPHNMSRVDLEAGAGEVLQREALSIFTDCTNANLNFRDALVAILLTGMQWGQAIAMEKRNE